MFVLIERFEMTIQDKQFKRDANLVTNVSGKLGFEALPSVRQSWYGAFFKRAFDIILVLGSAPIVVPVVLILCALVARDNANPFYRQNRLGRNGRVFSMWKLRSMVPDADQFLVEHLGDNPEAYDEWEKTQKLKNDPRITAFGHILRKSSMDELPQLWNVLIGDMSLVGPRPMMPTQRDLYPGIAYFSLRPGLTGYWQISDRNESSFPERARFDTRYYNDLSLVTDITVLIKTVGVVLRGTGY